jgi:hypothetical protein
MIPCRDCIDTWEAYGEDPPCGGACNPDAEKTACDQITEPLHPDNLFAWSLFLLVQDQHIYGPAGPAALSLPSVVAACELMQIPPGERMPLFASVRAAYHAAMEAKVVAAQSRQKKD